MATPLTKGSLSGQFRAFDWRDVDWSKTDEQISERYGPLPSTVAAMRLRYGPTMAPGDVKPSKPEPPPVQRGELVTPSLVAWLQARGDAEAAQLVLERDAFGRPKYGQGLMTDDGRGAVEDLRQELGDGMQYGWKAVLQGIDLKNLRPLALSLLAIIDESTRRAKERGDG